MNDPVELLDRFEAILRNHVAHVLEVARNSAPGGGPEWQLVATQLGLPAMSTAERGRIAGERRHGKGAFPEEVEGALAHLAGDAHATLSHMHGSGMFHGRPELGERIQALAARITTLAADHRKDYQEWLAPTRRAGAGVAGIFANAKATAQISPWSKAAWDQQLTLSCPGCGSPQRVELEFDCKYCGGSLFGPGPEQA